MEMLAEGVQSQYQGPGSVQVRGVGLGRVEVMVRAGVRVLNRRARLAAWNKLYLP